MARKDAVNVTTTPLTGVIVLANDHGGSDVNADQAETGPLPTMTDSQLRQRQRQSTAPSTARSGESEQTPASDSGQNAAQDGDLGTLPKSSVWGDIFGWLVKLVVSFQAPQPIRSKKLQEEYDKIQHNQLEDHTDGVPRFAALLDSTDEEWALFRRFGPQASRILVKKEVELQALADELHRLDENDRTNPSTNPTIKYRLNTTKHEEREIKGELENMLGVKINEYYDLLLKYSQVRSLRPASARDHHRVHTYMIQRRPFKRNEDTFFYQIDDVVYAKWESQAIGGKNKQMENFVNDFASSKSGHWFRNKLFDFLRDKEAQAKAKTKNVYHFSPIRRAIISKFIAALSAVAVILVPVLILYLANSLSPVVRAVVVGIFVLVFLVAVSILGEWGAHELFILMAAYTAILVALLSNLSQNSSVSK